jgi:hypothetical protein
MNIVTLIWDLCLQNDLEDLVRGVIGTKERNGSLPERRQGT